MVPSGRFGRQAARAHGAPTLRAARRDVNRQYRCAAKYSREWECRVHGGLPRRHGWTERSSGHTRIRPTRHGGRGTATRRAEHARWRSHAAAGRLPPTTRAWADTGVRNRHDGPSWQPSAGRRCSGGCRNETPRTLPATATVLFLHRAFSEFSQGDRGVRRGRLRGKPRPGLGRAGALPEPHGLIGKSASSGRRRRYAAACGAPSSAPATGSLRSDGSPTVRRTRPRARGGIAELPWLAWEKTVAARGTSARPRVGRNRVCP